ncbi:cyclic GMP-AMP synthase [Thunnus albacares]|uniref:cyclic GMP-AMP synthase n=1 Tax=Thunnus albacares TaxID=8236 RepID=UPI001CF6EB34|nr:cyclic GMP-AMP synthase [Thunnus albacares]
MTGRGRPRKAKSPDTKCAKSPTRAEETKQGSLPRCSGGAKEEKQNGTTKEQKPKKRQQKKPNHNEEKPSVQSTQSEKTTKHFTEEIGKQQKTSTDSTKAPVQGTKAKNYARRAKSPEQFTEETMKVQPVLPKCTTVDPVKTTKAKTCGKKAKSMEQFTDKMQPEIPKASVQVTKAKTCAGRTKSPENLTEETTKKRQKSFKSTREACEPQDKCKDKAGVDSILYTTLDTLKIKKDERSDAAKVINNIVRSIREHLKKNSLSFKEVQEPLRTGSYYENLKISNPDEFDVMLPIPVDRVDIEPFGNDGAFYSVALKRGKSPLTKFQQETGILSASEMLKEFREEVTKCVKTFKEWEMTRKKKGCPAVTLTTEVNSVTISLDVVLCLVVKSSWPAFTKDGFKIEGWLGTKMRQQYKYQPYYLVPKYEGKGTAESDGVLAKDVWRVSFSHVEKAILKNHGSEKTCCEEAGVRCCRKDCLKLLKHLLGLLKERGSFDKFCSYHAKTTLLHACCSRTRDTDWQASSLSHCFQMLLKDFEDHLDKGVLYNFFIPTQNLLSGLNQEKCRSLAKCIKDQRNNGFPIFK